MTGALEILECSGCRAAVALVDAPTVPCAYCGADVAIPEQHAQALRATRDGQAARAAAGARLEALGEKPQAALLWIARLAVVVLPAVAVFFAARSAALALSQLELSVYVALPAILPGVGLYLWTAVASGTSRRFCAALSAAPAATANGPMRCRSCAAPLAAPAEGHVVRCAYCLCDNLMREVELDVLQHRLSSALKTLDQALRLMRVRRALWGLGISFSIAVAAGLCALVRLAQR